LKFEGFAAKPFRADGRFCPAEIKVQSLTSPRKEKTVNQQKLYASRHIVVTGKFVFLTRILQAAKIGNFKCLPAQSFVRWLTVYGNRFAGEV
jgi:hypothetical protein